MCERKVWTEEQDVALRKILSKGLKKWNVVAQQMEKDFKIYGRTGKQCRQRWHNQLDPKINNQNWTQQEEHLLFKLHNQLGNSWAKISHKFKGRTDNSVKNHFYSTLRKALRRLNRHLVEIKSHKNKELKSIILTKLLSAAEDRFDKKLKLSKEVIDKSLELKDRLIKLSYEIDGQKEDHKNMEELIEELHSFTKSWKRKKKKGKKSQQELDNDDEGQEIDDQEKQDSIQIDKKDFKQMKSVNNSKTLRPIEVKTKQKIDVKAPIKLSVETQSVPLIQPLAQKFSSKKPSLIQMKSKQSQSMRKLLSNYSYYPQDDQLMIMRKRSSNRSSTSYFGNLLNPRFSQMQVPGGGGISLNQSNSNLGSKNLFQSTDSLVQRLDQS